MDDLEELLTAQTHKLTSTSDIIAFIIDYITQHSLHDITGRIEQLEEPRGLDHVMIEEVKAITEAMIEQREEQLRKDIQNYTSESIQDSMRALVQRESSHIRTSQTTSQWEQTIMNLRKEYQTNRQAISDLKHSVSTISREIISKITTHEVEKIVNQFQRDIFDKIAQNSQELRKLQQIIKKQIDAQRTLTRKNESKLKKYLKTASEQINNLKTDLTVCKQVSDGQSKLEKMEEKLEEKMKEEIEEKIEKELIKVREEQKRSEREHYEQISEIHKLLQQLINEQETFHHQQYAVKQAGKCRDSLKHQENKENYCAKGSIEIRKMLESRVVSNQTSRRVSLLNTPLLLENTPITSPTLQKKAGKIQEGLFVGGEGLKCGQVLWEDGNGGDSYIFQINKSPIKVRRTGYYSVICAIFSPFSINGAYTGEQNPSLCVNGQVIGQLQWRGNGSELKNSYQFHEVIELRDKMSVVTLKGGSQERRRVILKLVYLY